MTHISTPIRRAGLWAGLAAATLAGLCALTPPDAQAQERGGRGAAMGARGGGPRAGMMQGGPRMMQQGARIEPRIRSGAIDGRRGAFAGARPTGGAAPLTITRNRAYASQGGYRNEGRYYNRDRRYGRDRGWFPGLLAAPFLLPGALLGAGYWGDDDDYAYGYGYEPYVERYDYPAYQPRVAYSGPVSYGGAVGGYCATPQKTCQLYTPAEVGVGCSCRAPAGLPRFRGSVVP